VSYVDAVRLGGELRARWDSGADSAHKVTTASRVADLASLQRANPGRYETTAASRTWGVQLPTALAMPREGSGLGAARTVVSHALTTVFTATAVPVRTGTPG
jgi:hypothetical protein